MRVLPILVICAVLCLPQLSLAQNQSGDQELSVSYGRKSGTEILKWFVTSPPANRDRVSYNEKVSTTGNMFATYRYSFGSIFSLGVTVGTESFSYNSYHNDGYPYQGPNPYPLVNPFIANYKVNVTTVALEPKIYYYNHKRLKLYGLAGMGVRFYTQKPNGQAFDGIGAPVFVNTQMTPIGVSYGNKLSGFAEVGLGYKGLINGGLSYRIGRKAAKKEMQMK